MTTSTTALIIDRVVERMNTVANIGRVHDRMRLADNQNKIEKQLLAEVGNDTILRAWFVHLGKTQARQADSASRMAWDRTLLVEGWSQFNDAADTENDFQTMAEKVARVLWYDAQTTRLNSQILFAKPPSLADPQPRMFAGLVCSYVRLEMPISTIEDFTPS